jgi:hypothetical protein
MCFKTLERGPLVEIEVLVVIEEGCGLLSLRFSLIHSLLKGDSYPELCAQPDAVGGGFPYSLCCT